MDKAGRTRRAYIVEALLEYMIALLVIDAFLAAILKQVGVSDAVTGIVSSFISFACVAQLFSASLVRRGRSMRKMILILDLINQLMFASLYLTPFLPIPQGVKVGVCSGGAGEFAEEAKDLGCGLYVTGEASWGDVVAAENCGMKMVCAGHYETETFGVKALAKAMGRKLRVETVFIPRGECAADDGGPGR